VLHGGSTEAAHPAARRAAPGGELSSVPPRTSPVEGRRPKLEPDLAREAASPLALCCESREEREGVKEKKNTCNWEESRAVAEPEIYGWVCHL